MVLGDMEYSGVLWTPANSRIRRGYDPLDGPGNYFGIQPQGLGD